jgi:hypothetical protein
MVKAIVMVLVLVTVVGIGYAGYAIFKNQILVT